MLTSFVNCVMGRITTRGKAQLPMRQQRRISNSNRLESLENTPPAHDITLGGQKEKGLNDSRVYSSAVTQLALRGGGGGGRDSRHCCSSFPELRYSCLLMVS